MDPPLENDGFIKMRTAKHKSRFNRHVYNNDVITFITAIIAIIALNSYGLILPTTHAQLYNSTPLLRRGKFFFFF